MSVSSKKFMALFLVFCLVVLSGNLSAQQGRKGVQLSVERNDGQIIMGELITVKKDSLLLLDEESQADLSIPISEAKAINVHNKHRMIEMGLLFALGGAAAEGIIKKTDRKTTHGVGGDDDENISQESTSFALYGAIGLGIGVALGAIIGIDKTIQIQGRADAEIQQDLLKLSKKARIRGLQQ